MLKIGQTAPNSSEPFLALSACHRRVERFLYLLITVKREAQGRHLSLNQQEAVQVALRFFNEALSKHTADEEQSLFPRIRKIGPDAIFLVQLIEHLEEDHARVEDLHRETERLFCKWFEDGVLSFENTCELSVCLSKLSYFYHMHIRLEEEIVFNQAKRLLDEAEIAQIGSEMFLRRSSQYPVFSSTEKQKAGVLLAG